MLFPLFRDSSQEHRKPEENDAKRAPAASRSGQPDRDISQAGGLDVQRPPELDYARVVDLNLDVGGAT